MKFRFIHILLSAAAVASLASCEKFLSTEPVDQISSSSYFKTEKDLELYANGLIQSYKPTGESIGQGDNYSDLISSKTSTDFYRPGIWIPSKQTGWEVSSWKGIRRANILIEGIEKNKGKFSEEIYNHYMGVARFWRAYFYFAKVKTFGDVPWIDHTLKPGDELLTAGRDDRELVMHNVLEDLNFACENMSGSKTYDGVINKYVGLALKSRVCLFEGAYRKYHSVNPSTNQPWKGQYESSADFYRAASAAAREIMDSQKYSLLTGSASTVYNDIWRNTNFHKTTESIWSVEYMDGDSPVYNELTWRVNSGTYDQQCAPTKNLMRMFLNLDGTLAKPDVSINNEFTNRDWRLINTVHGPGHTYTTTSGAETLKPLNFSYTFTGYQFRKWSQEKEENYSKGRNTNDIPIFRYAEVLLNYAEAEAELGNSDMRTVWNETIKPLRERAGVKNIYPGDAGYTEDKWLKEYYNDPSLSNVILEIRRERVTEMILEDLRVDDLFRWNCGDLIVDRKTGNQGWMGIYVTADEAKNGLVFNGTKYTFTKASATGYKVGTSTADSNHSFSEGSYGYLIYNYKLEWLDRDYVRPIPTSALTKNPNLGQNYGWED